VGDDGGWLVPPDDPAALAGAIREIIGDPAEAGRRSQALRARIRAEFSPALQADRLITRWRELSGPARPGDGRPAGTDAREAAGIWD
jgi:glycosyltransferase involved in cell wall biosynthesis